jgi:hypothetical protein
VVVANVAARECAERYLALSLPNANVFCQLDERMSESGSVLPTPSMAVNLLDTGT